jgi:hypothetical protein
VVPIITLAFIWVKREQVKTIRVHLGQVFEPVTRHVWRLINCCECGRRWTRWYRQRNLKAEREKEFKRQMLDLERGSYDAELMKKLGCLFLIWVYLK